MGLRQGGGCIDGGRLVTQGSVGEVLSLGHQARLLTRVPDAGLATAVLARAGIVASAYDPVTDLLIDRGKVV